MLLCTLDQKFGRIPMVSSRSRGSIRPKSIEASGTKEGEAIRNFLEGELPPGEVKQAAYLTTVLLDAGARYDRYTARKEEWISYANRRNRLVRITKLSGELISSLCELDILSRDDLASRLGLKEVEALIGSIHFLSRETSYLANGAQKDGRPRDLAEERWILEVADLYENAFRRPARIWGSGDE